MRIKDTSASVGPVIAERRPQYRLLWRPREVADLIGVSRATCYKMIADGELPSLRIGPHLRVPAAALEKLIADGTKTEGADR